MRKVWIGVVVLVCVSGAQAQVVIETVPVGDPGNVDDVQNTGWCDPETCGEPCPVEYGCWGPDDCDPGMVCLPYGESGLPCMSSYCSCQWGEWVCTDDCASSCVDPSLLNSPSPDPTLLRSDRDLSFTLTEYDVQTAMRGIPTPSTVSPDAAYDSRRFVICGAVNYVYNIGKFEVTAEQYAEFLNTVAATDAYGLYDTNMWDDSPGDKACRIQRTGLSGSYVYTVAVDWANRPVNYVSWGDAARFCNWLHNGQPMGAQGPGTTEDGSYDMSATQTYYGPDGAVIDDTALNDALATIVREPDATWVIPTDEEWYKAAYYSGGSGAYYDYPTGSDSEPSNDLIDPDPGNNATFINHGHTIDSPYYRTEVGDHENSDSPYGTFDQGGNISEWTESTAGIYRRITRGGFYGNFVEAMASRLSFSSIPANGSSASGLRVAEVSEVGSVCGNGTIELGEGCDDGNTTDGDGCDAQCILERCGNYVVQLGEECDDGNLEGGDGCDALCVDEYCGDGMINDSPHEACDDGGTEEGDGCSATCIIEIGWECVGEPSVCAFTCGEGLIDPHHECDDGGTDDGDGCSSACMIEAGWECIGEPSVCFIEGIPTLSEWGLLAMTALLLGAGVYVVNRRQPMAA